MANVDWIEIKNEYINSNISYKDLSEKYPVSKTAIANRGKAENWVELRKENLNETCTKVVQKTAEKIVEAQVNCVDKILNLGEEATEQIAIAMTQLADEDGNIDTYKLRQVVQSLKDLKELVKDDRSGESKQKESHDELIEALRERNANKQTK